MKKTLENQITFRPRRCRFCGKPRANFVPELGKGFAHLKCWKGYQSAQQSVRRTGLQAGLFGESDTVTLERGDERLTITRR